MIKKLHDRNKSSHDVKVSLKVANGFFGDFRGFYLRDQLGANKMKKIIAVWCNRKQLEFIASDERVSMNEYQVEKLKQRFSIVKWLL